MSRFRNAPEVCVCLAARQLARQLTQYYDARLAPAGLTVGQFSMLAKLADGGPQAVAELAARLLMDRKTLGLALRPLERRGLVELVRPEADRRRREIRLSAAGGARLTAALPLWREAQEGFGAAYGADQAKALRKTLRGVIESMEDAGLSAPRPGPRTPREAQP